MDRPIPKVAVISVANAAIALPKGISHFIEHNPHADSGQSLADYLEFLDGKPDMNPDDMAECLATGELWLIQVYQTTSVGFIRGLGPTFERALGNLNG